MSTGIAAVDELLEGGLPRGTITEIVGPECSGHTSFTLSFLAGLTQTGNVCAWIDVSNALQPESAAAAGVELSRMLWVRCGAASKSPDRTEVQPNFKVPEKYFVAPPYIHGLHGGGCGGHPRGEVKGMANAIQALLRPEAANAVEPLRQATAYTPRFKPDEVTHPSSNNRALRIAMPRANTFSRIDQAIRVADLLLQGGGFSAIVLDMAGIAPEFSARIPLATWFRYRAAAERSQTSVLLLTQHACAKSSAGLVLNLRSRRVLHEQTIFVGLEHRIEVVRQRFAAGSNLIPLHKPVQRTPIAEWQTAEWQSRAAWAARG
jgi:hypothetical protein